MATFSRTGGMVRKENLRLEESVSPLLETPPTKKD